MLKEKYEKWEKNKVSRKIWKYFKNRDSYKKRGITERMQEEEDTMNTLVRNYNSIESFI